MSNFKKWLYTKEEYRYERYLSLLLTAFLTLLVSFIFYYSTKPSPCEMCLKCEIIEGRQAAVQAKIQTLNSNLITFKKVNNQDSIVAIESEIINLSIRLEETKNIIENLTHNK